MSADTWARRLSRPTTGSRNVEMRLRIGLLDPADMLHLGGIEACWSRAAVLSLRQQRAVWSSTLTARGLISGTLADTRCTMPAIWARSSVLPGCSVSSTEALGFCWSRKNRSGWDGQMDARAASTADSAVIEAHQLALETARWKLSRSWNWSRAEAGRHPSA